MNLIFVTCIMLSQLIAELMYIMYRQGLLIMFHIYVDLVLGLHFYLPHFYVPLLQNPKQPSNLSCTNESRRVVKQTRPEECYTIMTYE